MEVLAGHPRRQGRHAPQSP